MSKYVVAFAFCLTFLLLIVASSDGGAPSSIVTIRAQEGVPRPTTFPESTPDARVVHAGPTTPTTPISDLPGYIAPPPAN
jgi:hypothetical protein